MFHYLHTNYIFYSYYKLNCILTLSSIPILEMQHPLLNLLGTPLVPELGSDISACAAGDRHLALVRISAVRALPNKLIVTVRNYSNFACVATFLTAVTLCVKFRIHYIVVDVAQESHNRWYVAFHIWNFHIEFQICRYQRLNASICGRKLRTAIKIF